jgi:HNH endonuclease
MKRQSILENNFFTPSNEIMKKIKESFFYEEKTGVIYKKTYRNKALNNFIPTGTKTKQGYLKIRFFRKTISAHRIAYFLYFKKWPENNIDHINGIRHDNRIENLRIATKRDNARNKEFHRKNTRPIGTFFRKDFNKFTAQIHFLNKTLYLGSYKTEKEADMVVKKATKLILQIKNLTRKRLKELANKI